MTINRKQISDKAVEEVYSAFTIMLEKHPKGVGPRLQRSHQWQQQQGHGKRNKDRYSSPANDILNGLVHIFPHDLFIVHQQDHANQNNGKQDAVDDLRPE